MNPLAVELNETLLAEAPAITGMLSNLGRELYYPKGILTQTAEAKQKASRFNATIGIASEAGQPMVLPQVMQRLHGLSISDAVNYAPSFGRPDLRAAWSDRLRIANPSLRDKRISLPVVTSGITHGLSLVADLLVDRDDPLLLPDQLWGNYLMIFGVRRGAAVSRYPFYDGQGGFNVDGLATALADQPADAKVILVLNFPNNPTGYSPTVDEQGRLVETLTAAAKRGQRLVVVCDDAYFGLTYDESVAPESLFAPLADAHPNILAVKLDGATKEDYVWGFRLGFMTFGVAGATAGVYDALEKKTAGCLRGTISNCSAPAQAILLQAMADPDYATAKAGKRELLAARARRVREILADPRFAEVWEPYPFNSGYFMCVRLKQGDAESLRVRLLDQYGVGVIATAEKDIRIAFSCVEENQLAELFDILYTCAREMSADQ